MNASELMIDNYIQWNHEDSVSYIRVDADIIGRIARYNLDPNVDEFVRGLWYAPIPITPELLEKAGFVKRPVDWFITFNDIEVCWHDVQGVSVGFDSDVNSIYKYLKHIKHLHQLQNLCFLLGKPLNIEL